MSTLEGIDVSSWQGGAFDWAAWRGRIAFAGIKISEGAGWADPDAARNMAQARAEGLVRIAYHFLHPDQPAAAQAAWFLAQAHAAGLGPGDLAAMDHEVTDGLPPAAVAACAAEFAQLVHAGLGVWPVTYTSQGFPEAGCCAGLGMTPAWIANPSHVTLPSPLGPWSLVSFEQTGQRGIDTDVFYGDAAELARLAIPRPAAPKPLPVKVSRAAAEAALSEAAAALAKLSVAVSQLPA